MFPHDELNQSRSRMVTRRDYVPKDREDRYLTRDANGVTRLRLVDAGDRLTIWSPEHGGALLNPKGPGLRHHGLVATYARGSTHYAAACKAADLSKGRMVELRREPENPYDKNAIAMIAPGGSRVFGYVQRGRAAALVRRMDAGERLAAVSMRGPGKGRNDDVAFVLIGSESDIQHMLAG